MKYLWRKSQLKPYHDNFHSHFFDFLMLFDQKIRAVKKKKMSIFETLLENIITVLPITYQNKAKMPGKNTNSLVYL